MLDISSISAIVAAVGVLVEVVLTVLELRNLVRQRRTDLVVALSNDATSREFVEALADTWSVEFKDYDDFVNKYGAPVSRNPISVSVLVVCNFFEHLGVLVKNKLVDAHLVFQLFAVAQTWEKVKLKLYLLCCINTSRPIV